eukprot:5246256-Pyramimonas_sp.AAC.1
MKSSRDTGIDGRPNQLATTATRGRFSHSALKIVNCLAASLRLLNRNNFKESAKDIALSVLPVGLSSDVVEMMSTYKLPSKSTLQRSQSVFDAALVRSFQKQCPLHDSYMWMWADATPQQNIGELFLAEILLVAKSDLDEMFKVATEFARSGP